MNVTVKHLKAFVELANCQSYATASKRLNLSQPAISICIKNLEEQVGGALFMRSTRVVELTPEGEAFFPKAKKLLLDWYDTFDEVHQLFSLKQGRLTIAAMPSFAASVLPQILTKFSQAYPRIRLDVIDVVMETVLASVSNGEADLGIVFEPDHVAELYFKPLLQNQFIVITEDCHDIVNRVNKRDERALELAEIAHHPMVMMNRGSSIRLWLEQAFEDCDNAPNISAEAWQLDTLGEMVKAGLGMAIVPELCRPQMQRKGLICHDLNNDYLKRNVGVIYKQKSSLSAPATAFFDMLSQEFDSRI